MQTITEKNYYTAEDKPGILQKIAEVRGDLEDISIDIASEQVLNWPLELHQSEDMKAVYKGLGMAILALERVEKFVEEYEEE